MIILAAAALDLARRGARVHPLRPGDKRPLLTAWPTLATTEAATVAAWWHRYPTAGIGLATGRGLMVLDVDPRHGGTESLAALPELPETREALTGGGGRHLYFHSEARCSAGLLGPGLDIRGAGGYVVAPPSPHPSGRRYEWHPTRGLRHPVADAPAWLLGRLRPRPPPAPAPHYDPPPDLDRVVRRARAWLARVPPAVAYQGGHLATLRAALGLVRGFELPEEMALGLLADWNVACEPPWSERELRHKVESAARAAVEPGYLLRRPRRAA